MRQERRHSLGSHLLHSLAALTSWLLLAGFLRGGDNNIPLCGITMKAFSWFLLIWWTFGTGCFTFDAPFTGMGNGFFASWLAFVGALILAITFIPFISTKFNEARNTVLAKYMGLMCFASGVNLVASAVTCSQACGGFNAWAWHAPPSVSFSACFASSLRPGSLGSLEGHCVAYFLGAWWTIGVFTVRSRPLRPRRNRYLSAWLAWVVALGLNGISVAAPVRELQMGSGCGHGMILRQKFRGSAPRAPLCKKWGLGQYQRASSLHPQCGEYGDDARGPQSVEMRKR